MINENVAMTKSTIDAVVDHLAQADALLPMPSLLAYLSPSMQCLFASTGFVKWIGLPRDVLVGQKLAFILDEINYKRFEARFNRVFFNGETITDDYQVNTIASRRWAEIRLSACLSPSKEIIGVSMAVSDIHDRKRSADKTLKDCQKQLKLLSDGIPAPIAFLDTLQRYRFANRAYLKWLGKSFEEMRESSLKDALTEPEYKTIQPHVERALKGEAVSYEREIELKDGSKRWMNIHYVAELDRHEQVRGVWAIFTDIDRQKRAENELRKGHLST